MVKDIFEQTLTSCALFVVVSFLLLFCFRSLHEIVHTFIRISRGLCYLKCSSIQKTWYSVPCKGPLFQ